MIKARIPIHRNPDRLWVAGPSSVQLTPEHQIPVAAARPDESLEDLIETLMGEALFCLDKHGRRGSSDPIDWEILVDDVPYCYRCVQPMMQHVLSVEAPERLQWQCATCRTNRQ